MQVHKEHASSCGNTQYIWEHTGTHGNMGAYGYTREHVGVHRNEYAGTCAYGYIQVHVGTYSCTEFLGVHTNDMSIHEHGRS